MEMNNEMASSLTGTLPAPQAMTTNVRPMSTPVEKWSKATNFFVIFGLVLVGLWTATSIVAGIVIASVRGDYYEQTHPYAGLGFAMLFVGVTLGCMFAAVLSYFGWRTRKAS